MSRTISSMFGSFSKPSSVADSSLHHVRRQDAPGAAAELAVQLFPAHGIDDGALVSGAALGDDASVVQMRPRLHPQPRRDRRSPRVLDDPHLGQRLLDLGREPDGVGKVVDAQVAVKEGNGGTVLEAKLAVQPALPAVDGRRSPAGPAPPSRGSRCLPGEADNAPAAWLRPRWPIAYRSVRDSA